MRTSIQFTALAVTLAVAINFRLYTEPVFWILSIAVIVLFGIRVLWHIRWPLQYFPTPPGGHWLMGETNSIVSDPSGLVQRAWAESVPNDGVLCYTVFWKPRLLLTNPVTIREVLVTNCEDYEKPALLRTRFGPVLGMGILLAEGDVHKQQRKNLAPAFSFSHIKGLIPTFWMKSRELVERLAEETQRQLQIQQTIRLTKNTSKVIHHPPGVLSVADWSMRATLDIIGLTGMGKDFNSLSGQNNKLEQAYNSVFMNCEDGWLALLLTTFLPPALINYLPFELNREINDASTYIKQVCRKVIAEKRKKMETNSHSQGDIISIAIESGHFTEENLLEQALTFLVGGHETMSTAVLWAIYLLCKHQAVQQRLRKEIRSKIPTLATSVTAKELDECHYLHAVCSEVLRLWSPVGVISRDSIKDTSIAGHFVPKDTRVIISPWITNTSKVLWGENAHEFRPERWLDAGGRCTKHGTSEGPFSIMTFFKGPRSCLGEKFARTEIACLLAAWIGRYQTDFEDGSPLLSDELPKLRGGFTSEPKDGVWVKLTQVDGW